MEEGGPEWAIQGMKKGTPATPTSPLKSFDKAGPACGPIPVENALFPA